MKNPKERKLFQWKTGLKKLGRGVKNWYKMENH
jgi:hypothetical protein